MIWVIEWLASARGGVPPPPATPPKGPDRGGGGARGGGGCVPRPAAPAREAARPAGGGGALGRARDQLSGQPPGQAHAALGGVHRLGDREAVVPEVVAEAQGGLPVD